MNKYLVIFSLLGCFTMFSFILSNNGKAGYTSAPGEVTCNTTNCHGGNILNTPGGSIIISSTGLTGWQYIPGQTYAIDVTVSRTGVNLYGFGFEALKSNGSNGGQLLITNSAQTQIKNALIGINTRANVVHTLNGGFSVGTHTFTFNWTAPVSGTGNITFYASGNAANGNNNTSGDFIYTTSQVVTPVITGINNPDNFNVLNVFPNPALDRVNLQINFPVSSSVILKLTTLEGKEYGEIYNEKLNAGVQGITAMLPLNLKKGIYLLSLQTLNQTFVKKIIVL